MLHPAKAAVGAKRKLARLKRPVGEFDASRYFRGADDLGFYNVGTAAVRSLARQIFLTHRNEWSVSDAMTFADRLIVDRYLEVKSLGIEVVARYRRHFTPPLLRRWRGWLAKNYSANWATTDLICAGLIGPLLLDYPKLGPGMRAWARDSNMWVRRASIVALIPRARRGQSLDLVYAIAKHLHADREDLIQKAVGWALREAGKADMERLEDYLRMNGGDIPRTTVRYATERFPPPRRAALLNATRLRPTARA